MIRHRSAGGRAQGTGTRRGAHHALTLLAAAVVTVSLAPLVAPSTSAAPTAPTAPAVARSVASATVSGTMPTMSGTLVVGSTLTATAGTWGPVPVSLTYQWYRSGTAVAGATASTYRLAEADRTATMTVVVVGRKSGYAARGRVSKPTTKVLGRLVSYAPTISGEPRVGQQLYMSSGTWGPGLVRRTVQWYRSGVAIPGATTGRYLVTEADRLRQISATLIGRKDGYAAQARTSKPVRIWGEFTGGDPVITHFDPVTSTFTAVPGTWTPTPTTVRYQWYIWGGAAIPGATGLRYTVAPEYRRYWLQLKAFATRDHYLTGVGYSEETQPIEW